MTRVGSCVVPKHSRAALLTFAGFAISPFASGQSTSDFLVVSPQPAIQLLQVEKLPSNSLQFTFSNTTNKPILEICISAQRGPNEMVCKLGGTNEAKLPAPEETFSMDFDPRGFPLDGQKNTLSVDAVVYSDGSHFGKKEILADMAIRMAGIALESKRISDLLSNSPDLSAAGLDSVVSQIGTSAPSSPAEAAEELKGESLPGISVSVLDRYRNSPNHAFLEGVALERNAVLREIEGKKTLAALPLTGSKNRQQAVLGAKMHGRSDLAQKYQALNELHVSYLKSFIESNNVR
jgi:hypothetical protein